jgi:hypothetical protein
MGLAMEDEINGKEEAYSAVATLVTEFGQEHAQAVNKSPSIGNKTKNHNY